MQLYDSVDQVRAQPCSAHLNADIEDQGIQQGHIVAGALHDGVLLAEGNATPQGRQEGPTRVPRPQVAVYCCPTPQMNHV